MDKEQLAAEVLAEVSAGKNFREISPAFIRQIVLQEMQPDESRKETVKRVRSKLHQVANAYRAGSQNYRKLSSQIAGQRQEISLEPLKPLCLELMQSHASTKERIPILDIFYREIFDRLPEIRSVLDLACGLNPLAIPWMKLAPDFSYLAIDLYQDMADLLNSFFGMAAIDGSARVVSARVANLLTEFPVEKADLTLLLKTLPVLEQVEKGAGSRILSQIQSRWTVVSFPIFSLSGKQKGMKTNYENYFMGIIDPGQWRFERIEFSNELVFLLERI